VVGIEAAPHLQRPGFLPENPPDRAVVRLPTEADVDYVRYLVQVEGRVLGLEVDDESPYGGRKLPAFCGLGVEEALHPFFLEAVHPAVEHPFGEAHLLGTLGHRISEEHQRTGMAS
jgi:hypothetical protein